MKKALLFILVLLPILLTSIGRTSRNILQSSVNRVKDSQESLIVNEIDYKLMKDFSSTEGPTEVEFTSNSLQYSKDGEVVLITSDSKNKLNVSINYEDGTKWSSVVPGAMEINEVEVVNVDNEVKVDLTKTKNRVLAVTYRFTPTDSNEMRGTINRDFTRYLIISR